MTALIVIQYIYMYYTCISIKLVIITSNGDLNNEKLFVQYCRFGFAYIQGINEYK